MNKEHPLFDILKKQKMGIPKGIYSVCSANEYVLEALMEKGKEDNDYILIEATCNQVNQYGGYTGMKPIDFKNFVYKISEKVKFPKEKIILAGDHLGPNPWKNQKEDIAMEKSFELIKLYVEAGFNKIHLDASMHLLDDDKEKLLDPKIIAKRSAKMARVAEETFKQIKSNNCIAPVYVIGTEVPPPGGQQEHEEELKITEVQDFIDTVNLTKEAFLEEGIAEAWERVIAVVVQPGVEFGHEEIVEYDRQKANNLTNEIKNYERIIFEGHSTDYQSSKALKELVEDGVAILKVGPALTFAVREALFALYEIEKELYKYELEVKESNFKDILDMAMLENPMNWKEHYHGSEKELKLARKYSYSDRARYYYLIPSVIKSMNRLITNLNNKNIPKTLLSQYMPIQYKKIREGKLSDAPEDLIKDRVKEVLSEYSLACNSYKKENLWNM